MQNGEPRDVDEYAAAQTESLARWTPPQRTAFAAAMAERWLPVYEAVSRSGSADDRALLRRAADAVWDAALGEGPPEAERERLRQRVAELARSEDDGGDERAASACRVVGAALACSSDGAGVEATLPAALAAYDGAARTVPGGGGGGGTERERKRGLWQHYAVLSEISQQRMMLELVGEHPVVDDGAVARLRHNCMAALPHMPEHLLRMQGSTATLGEIPFPAASQLSGMVERIASLFGALGRSGAQAAGGAGPPPPSDDMFQNAFAEAMRRVGERHEHEHERHVAATVGAWSPEQRLAFVAALAERWLPEYEAYCAEEQWGNPRLLREIMDAVWDHLRGRRLSERARAGYSKQVGKHAPHTEDLDSQTPLVACMVLDYALDCCKAGGDAGTAETAASECCEARMSEGPTYPPDVERERRQWEEPAVRDEVAKQAALLEWIGGVSRFDGVTVDALRAFAARA